MIVGGLSIVATVALFIGSAIIVSLAVAGGVVLLSKLERFYLTRRAIHDGLNLSNETLSDGTDGDRFVTPRDFKTSFHDPLNDTGAQRDHA